jgi:hypothetical protein
MTAMKMNSTKTGVTHAASFRISDAQHQEFLALLASVPGSDVGNMYREIFARGLQSLKAFYAQQGITSDGSDAKEGA